MTWQVNRCRFSMRSAWGPRPSSTHEWARFHLAVVLHRPGPSGEVEGVVRGATRQVRDSLDSIHIFDDAGHAMRVRGGEE